MRALVVGETRSPEFTTDWKIGEPGPTELRLSVSA